MQVAARRRRRRPASATGLSVDPHQALDVGLLRVVRPRPGQQRVTIGSAQLGVVPEGAQAARQRLRLIRRHAAARTDQLGQAAEARAHHRHPGGHRLERGVRRELVVARRHDECARPGEQLVHERAVRAAHELDRRAQPARERGELPLCRPLPGDPQRHTGGRRRLDRRVDALLGGQPRRHERVAAGGRAGALGERLSRQVVRQHLEPSLRQPVPRELARGPVARRHEAIHAVQDEPLVEREAGGVGR